MKYQISYNKMTKIFNVSLSLCIYRKTTFWFQVYRLHVSQQMCHCIVCLIYDTKKNEPFHPYPSVDKLIGRREENSWQNTRANVCIYAFLWPLAQLCWRESLGNQCENEHQSSNVSRPLAHSIDITAHLSLALGLLHFFQPLLPKNEI